MKKYLYLICLLCCCAFVSNMQVVSAQSSAPYVRVGLLQGVQEIVITANDDFVVKDVDNKVNYKFKKMNEVNIRQKDRTVYVNKKGKETTTLVVAVKDNAPVIVNGKRYRGNLIYENLSDHRLRRFYWFQLCALYAQEIPGDPAGQSG